MKRFVLASLIALAASQAAGCIIESGDDEDARISATWQLKNVATNQTTLCPAGYDTAALYNQPIDAAGNNAGPVIVDLFNCDDGAGTSAPLAPTTYKTWIEIATHNNTGTPYAKSLSANVDVTFDDKTFNAQILNDGGYFMLTWNLYGASSNQDLSCATAGSQGVETVSTNAATPAEFKSDIFDCEDQYGITAGLVAGNYTVSVAALGANDASIGTAPTLTNKTIQRQNLVTDLGNVMIPITGK